MAVAVTGQGPVTQASRHKILPVLRKLGGKATLGEVVAGTGLPAPEAAATLWALVSELEGQVDVGQGGDILFRFPPSLKKPTRSEAWAHFWGGLYKMFKAAFKIGIMLVLIVYFVIFALLALAMLVASLAKGDSDSSSDSWSSSGQGSSFDLGEFLGWLWITDSRPNYQPYDRWQRSRGMSVHPQTSQPSPPLYQKVVAYVFGDEQPPADPSLPDRETLAYVREQGGYLTATDLIMLRGTRGPESAQIASRLAFSNGGFVEVTDQGVVLFRLEEIMSRLDRGSRSNESWGWCWESPEPEQPMNSNGGFFNFCVTAVNGFNLVFAGFLAFSPEAMEIVSDSVGTDLSGLQMLLGSVPFLFSALFFLIPFLRSFWVAAENRRRASRNRWRALLKQLFRTHVEPRQAGPVTAQSLGASPQELRDLARAYDAREDSPGAWVFDRLRQEWAEVSAARRGVAHLKWRFGGKVFSTDDGLLGATLPPASTAPEEEAPRQPPRQRA